MRYSLINPPWTFDGSIYFGCREPHLPLEYGYSKALLEAAGHEVDVVDAQLDGLSLDDIRERVRRFPARTSPSSRPRRVICSGDARRRSCASRWKWCAQCATSAARWSPSVRMLPRRREATLPQAGRRRRDHGRVRGVLPRLPATGQAWICYAATANRVNGAALRRYVEAAGPPLDAPRRSPDTTTTTIASKRRQTDPGAEMETSRGCPYHCTFCAKDNFRNLFRRRPLERDRARNSTASSRTASSTSTSSTRSSSPTATCWRSSATRHIKFGIQTRIDLWSEEMLDLLGDAGCVSIEAGVESITEAGRDLLDKKCKISTDEISATG